MGSCLALDGSCRTLQPFERLPRRLAETVEAAKEVYLSSRKSSGYEWLMLMVDVDGWVDGDGIRQDKSWGDKWDEAGSGESPSWPRRRDSQDRRRDDSGRHRSRGGHGAPSDPLPPFQETPISFPHLPSYVWHFQGDSPERRDDGRSGRDRGDRGERGERGERGHRGARSRDRQSYERRTSDLGRINGELQEELKQRQHQMEIWWNLTQDQEFRNLRWFEYQIKSEQGQVESNGHRRSLLFSTDKQGNP